MFIAPGFDTFAASKKPIFFGDWSALVVRIAGGLRFERSAEAGFGNGFCIPAGPLREPVAAGLARADLVLAVGPAPARARLRARWPALDALPVIEGEVAAREIGIDWSRERVLAFAGIARPEKFFATLRGLGRGREGAAAAEAGLARHPGDGELRVQRALSLLSAHDWAAGFEAFAARWETGELVRAACPLPEWRGEDPAGRRILVLPEQGFGDALLMTRFLPVLAARGAEVFLAAKPALTRLFDGLPGVTRLLSTGDPWPDAEFSAHMMDLPRWLGVPETGPPPSPPLRIPDRSKARAARLITWIRVRLPADASGAGGQPAFRARACRVSCSVCGISTSIAWLPVLSRAGLAFNTLERHHPACVRPRRDLHVACVSDESRCPHKRWCGAGQVGLCGRDRGGCPC